MAGRIAMDVEELYAKSAEFTSESSEVEAMVSRLDTMITTLRETWEGDASAAFEEQYREIEPSVKALGELLNTIGGQLTTIATTMQDQDQAIASKLGL